MVVAVDSVIAEMVVVGFQEEEEVAGEDFLIEETGFRVIRVEKVEALVAEAVGKGCLCS